MESAIALGTNEVIILIAEDDDGHALLIKQGLRDSGVMNKIVRFGDGQELWEYLKAEKEIKSARNYLILLDINMPRMDGVEVLRLIKNDADLRETPVMMLTTTDDPREIEKCYEIGCNVYITKPVDFKKFAETLKRIGLFIQIIKV